MSDSLVFDATTHTYSFGGSVIPGVTSVLRATGLIDYSMIPHDVLDAAARRGTAVHLALQHMDEGRPMSLPLELHGYIRAYLRFCADSGFLPGHIEHRVFHPAHRYAGTLDRTGMLGADLVVLDFKTGVVLPGHALQLAAYAYTQPMPRRFRRIALQLERSGSYRVHEYPRASFQKDVDSFLEALRSLSSADLTPERTFASHGCRPTNTTHA